MRFVLTCLLAVVAAMALHSSARAAFTVTLSVQGFGSQTISDNGAGDTDVRTNFINSIGAIDGYTYAITANTNSPSGGFGGQFVVQQNALVTANSETTGALTIFTSSDDFTTGSASAVTLSVFNALAETTFNRGVAIAITTITPPGGSTGTTPEATVLGGPIPSSDQTTSRVVVSSNPFTISNTLTITGLTRLAGEGIPQFNGSLTSTALDDGGASAANVVPAPAGIVLAVTALPLFGLLRRRWGTATKVIPSDSDA